MVGGSPRGSPVAAAFADHWPTLVARLARRFGDLTIAEECAADAFAAAVPAWREQVPDEPGAWLWTTASRRAIDRLRREQRFADRAHLLAANEAADESANPTHDQLALLFGMCHPSLSSESQIALTLRCLNGLSTAQIAGIFGTTTDTMTRRLTRARDKLAANAIAFDIPPSSRWGERLDPVLEVVYLTFTAGHASRDKGSFIRGDLCEEARWLCSRILGIAPEDPEVLGLAALLDLTDARRPARQAPDGSLILLADQDRERWDRPMIVRGSRLLAEALRQRRLGRFQIQAAIAGCHSMAPTWERTDWPTIVRWYDTLLALDDTPVTRLNRAVALSHADRAEEALEELRGLEAALGADHYYWLAVAEARERLGEIDAARDAYETALAAGPHDSEVGAITERLRALDSAD